MSRTLISGQNICKAFEQREQKTQILQDITVDIFEGDFTIVMGASGAGKSTLLYALSGMDKITSGTLKYKEKKISDFSEGQMAELRANEFGFIFQQTHLVSNLTLFENVAVAGYISNKKVGKKVQERTRQLLDQMNVKDAQNRLPSQTSGGEGQRAAIARALINEPGIVFADEPTGALNKANTTEVLNILTELHRNGQSILMVTHDLRAAIRGNRLLYIEDGKIINELNLSPYQENVEESRESTVSDWLASMKW